jgi:2-polyprenyl-6-methoxyphenol hydroxylase-like FAD-dependent oxidoreductase
MSVWLDKSVLSIQADVMTNNNNTSEQWDVAVVGAGPVGLLLSSELASRKIRVVVFEQAETASAIPKANGIVGHSALELANRGIFSDTDLQVVSPPQFQFGSVPLDLGVEPGNPLHILPIPQRRLEQLLEQRATEAGVQLQRGRDVLGFEQDDAGVTINVAGPDGVAHVRAQYLVGCDGAHSLVRKLSGIGFPGFTSEEIARIARVTIPGDRIARAGDGFDIPGVGHVAAMRPNQLPGGGFSMAPVSALDPNSAADLYLISTHEPRGNFDASNDVPVEELRASLTRVLGEDLPFTDATAIRSTVGSSRQADAYRRGRVFLAGDAAHIFNAGGSALNVGIQDALDLADVLGGVLSDGKPLSELDSYEARRRPAGEQALNQTRAQAALARADESGSALRAIVGELTTDRTVARSLAQLLELA